MSRSGYTEEMADQWALIRWRGAVKSAIRGKRGQSFLKEMATALDALPQKQLIPSELQRPSGAVCAIGAVGAARGLDMKKIDPENSDRVSRIFGISEALAREIAYENDEGTFGLESPEHRFSRMRRWVADSLSSEER